MQNHLVWLRIIFFQQVYLNEWRRTYACLLLWERCYRYCNHDNWHWQNINLTGECKNLIFPQELVMWLCTSLPEEANSCQTWNQLLPSCFGLWLHCDIFKWCTLESLQRCEEHFYTKSSLGLSDLYCLHFAIQIPDGTFVICIWYIKLLLRGNIVHLSYILSAPASKKMFPFIV